MIGIRATHFCSWCQRLPAAERPAAAALLATMTPRPGRGATGRADGDGWTSRATARSARTVDEAATARQRSGEDGRRGRDASGGRAVDQPVLTDVCPGSVIEITPP